MYAGSACHVDLGSGLTLRSAPASRNRLLRVSDPVIAASMNGVSPCMRVGGGGCTWSGVVVWPHVMSMNGVCMNRVSMNGGLALQ